MKAQTMPSNNGIEPDGYRAATVYLNSECRVLDCEENKNGRGSIKGYSRQIDVLD
jgi:hypothetical protein